ncbi:MAG: 23S rRNA (adenine(2503)-C(2))-methyltransferase RlmN [Candidatus Zixiibacteriota bacterium]
MGKINLIGMTVSEIEQLAVELGAPQFKGRQLFKWLYKLLEVNFLQMTDLSKNFRQILEEGYYFGEPEIFNISRSKDKTEKIVFKLDDKELIEAVIIPDSSSEKATVCISSQVGCPLGCKFCATGMNGYKRNLTTGEIVGQLTAIRRKYGQEAFQNIVFMGMGEPFLNYENVVRAVEIISLGSGLSLSAKRITISTVGLIKQIELLANSKLKVNLAISLHAPTDEKRKILIPTAKANPLKKLMKACGDYAYKTKKRVTFEYILFKGFNDSYQDAIDLAKLVKGIPCKINILAYNPVENLPFERPSEDEINEFGKILYPLTPAVTVRKSRGLDISAACGQLAGQIRNKCMEDKVNE